MIDLAEDAQSVTPLLQQTLARVSDIQEPGSSLDLQDLAVGDLEQHANSNAVMRYS